MSETDRTAVAAHRWARTWTDAWEALQVEPIVALYAAGATFSSQPFRAPYRGRDGVRDYVTGAFAAEVGPRVWMSAPIVDGNRASVSWWCALRDDGSDTTLAGTSVLRFDADGLVVEQWDAWNVVDRRTDPPLGWSPFADRDG
jgi:nuclear transport factor 2 (NTF2) superfamily protein